MIQVPQYLFGNDPALNTFNQKRRSLVRTTFSFTGSHITTTVSNLYGFKKQAEQWFITQICPRYNKQTKEGKKNAIVNRTWGKLTCVEKKNATEQTRRPKGVHTRAILRCLQPRDYEVTLPLLLIDFACSLVFLVLRYTNQTGRFCDYPQTETYPFIKLTQKFNQNNNEERNKFVCASFAQSCLNPCRDVYIMFLFSL